MFSVVYNHTCVAHFNFKYDDRCNLAIRMLSIKKLKKMSRVSRGSVNIFCFDQWQNVSMHQVLSN